MGGKDLEEIKKVRRFFIKFWWIDCMNRLDWYLSQGFYYLSYKGVSVYILSVVFVVVHEIWNNWLCFFPNFMNHNKNNTSFINTKQRHLDVSDLEMCILHFKEAVMKIWIFVFSPQQPSHHNWEDSVFCQKNF